MVMIKKYSLSLVILIILQTGYSKAQESMMTEVSYVFLEKLIATAKENYPRVNSFKSRMSVAKSALTAQKSNWLDGLSFSYVYAPNNTLNLLNQPGTTPSFFNGYQVAISFSVTELFQKGAGVKQAKENIKLVEYDEEEYNLSIETQVKTRYYSYVQQVIGLKLQSKLYADALSMNKDLNNKYAKGEATFTDYLSAQVALTGALQAKISAEATYLAAKATLEELLTKKIEEIQ